jgi:hypothetical protein
MTAGALGGKIAPPEIKSWDKLAKNEAEIK